MLGERSNITLRLVVEESAQELSIVILSLIISFLRFPGLDSWTSRFDACGHAGQSPIALTYDGAQHSDLGPIQLMDYDSMDFVMDMLNNGHTGKTANPVWALFHKPKDVFT